MAVSRSSFSTLVLIACCLSVNLSGQIDDLKFENLTVLDGLPVNNVQVTLQDSMGFLWMGTTNGLVRYDGHDMTVYQYDSNDPHSLDGFSIRSLYEDASGEIWVGSQTCGLNRFNRSTETFTQFRPSQYDSSIFDIINDLQVSNPPIAAILDIKNDLDSSVVFSLPEETTFLISAMGEGMIGEFWNYGWIEYLDSNIVWEMNFSKSFWAGGHHKNKIQIELMTLPAGSYRLCYQTENKYPFAQPGVSPPLHPHLLGIQLLAVKDKRVIETTLARQQYHEGIQFGIIYGMSGSAGGNILWIINPWFGLCRIDTKSGSFRSFYVDASDPKSIPTNRLFCIYTDQEGIIWIGADRGLIKFDPAVEIFTLFQSDISKESGGDDYFTSIHEDRAGVIWLGSYANGLFKFDKKNGNFQQYAHDPDDPNSLSNNRVTSISEDNQGMLWLTVASELNLFDKTGRFQHFRFDSEPDNGLAGVVNSIYKDHSDVMWLNTWLAGGYRVDRNSQPLSFYHNDPDNTNILSSNFIDILYEDRSGAIWIGTRNDGLNKIVRQKENDGEEIFIHYRHDPSDTTSLASNTIWAIYEDLAGNLWAGGRGGLSRLKPNNRDKGIFVNYRRDTNNPNSLSSNTVNTIYEDRSGTIWVGTRAGLEQFHPETEIFTRGEIGGNFVVIKIYEDESGTLWLGTEKNGLIKYNRKTQQSILYQFDDIGVGEVFVIHEDAGGRFWVRTANKGLHLLDRESGNFSRFTHKYNLVAHWGVELLEDGDGLFWLGRWGGISIFDPETKLFRDFPLNDEISDLRITSAFMSPRSGEMIWGGKNGLVIFHPDSIQTNPYPPPVAITELKLFNEVVEVGGDSPLKKAISVSDTLQLAYWQNDIALKFAALQYNDPAANQYAFYLENYEKNWRFVGTQREANYTNLDPGEYVFRVKAANNHGLWNEEGKSLRIIISPPWWQTSWAYGLYALLMLGLLYGVRRFEINRQKKKMALQMSRKRAEDAEELAGERARMLSVVEEKNAELIRTREQLIVQEKLASLGQLTAGIAHEIKNPLNFVNNFAELLVEMVDELKADIEEHKGMLDAETLKKSEEVLEDAEDLMIHIADNAVKINEHGKRANNIVNGMLQHSRGKSGEFQATDLNALLDEYINLAYHGMRAKNGDFNVTIERDFDDTVGEIPLVPQDISRVFLNLLNNAFEAFDIPLGPPSKGEARVVVSSKNLGEQVAVRIRDNGPGIPEDIRKQIFNPFFTTKPTGQGNTGLGLSISHDIVVKVHRGEIAVDSQPGEFTEFVIRLPKKQ